MNLVLGRLLAGLGGIYCILCALELQVSRLVVEFAEHISNLDLISDLDIYSLHRSGYQRNHIDRRIGTKSAHVSTGKFKRTPGSFLRFHPGHLDRHLAGTA